MAVLTRLQARLLVGTYCRIRLGLPGSLSGVTKQLVDCSLLFRETELAGLIQHHGMKLSQSLFMQSFVLSFGILLTGQQQPTSIS